MKWLVIERFAAGGDTVTLRWRLEAKDEEEAKRLWREFRSVGDGENEYLTPSGNMIRLEFVSNIPEEDFEVLSKYVREII